MHIFSLFRRPVAGNPARELAQIGIAKRRATVAERTAELRRDIAMGRIAPIADRDVVVRGVAR